MRAGETLVVKKSLGCFLAMALPVSSAMAQQLTLANPDWNITLSDFGYSDFMLDNTPGFEGREYLSGEWGAAVGYQLGAGPVVSPQWLEPNFIYPDWPTLSPFLVKSALTQTGLNADNLPIAQSVITNNHLQITLRHEMLDTVVGTPMGITPASATSTGAFIHSSRYVLKQTTTIKNISGSGISNVQFFQFLHGLQSQRGIYDDRLYDGALSEFRYDVTQAGVDSWAVGPGSSSAGLEDYIGFHASVAPSGYEIGHYGIEGNGVDDHFVGKPSDGVHLSVENNWLTEPYSLRLGTDYFAPAQRWIAGAQRWNLGSLAAGQQVSLDVLLTLRTGTKVTTGNGSTGGCNGGSGVPGGLDYEFEDVSSEGSCFGEYSKADANELEVHIARGEFEPFTFPTPGQPAQLWKVDFTGEFVGSVWLTFAYDPTLLPAGFDEDTLSLYQFVGGSWQRLDGVVDTARHTIAVTVSSLSVFALGADGGATFTLDASVAPANSGTITGAGTYADGSSVSLVAAASAGYVFSNWTEGGSVVSVSPSYTFIVHANRTLQANFATVGSAKAITTSSLPANGGSTSGDGAYALGSSATVVATANPGYKFSKWLVDGITVSTSRTNTFTVTGDRALVAKFKPVYSIVVSAEPVNGGDVEADPVYEFGELAKLKAKPFAGYCFVNWTQNGTVVSTKTNYEFNVTASRTLVGHFALGKRIEVAADPVSAGTVTGGDIYPTSASVTVEACAQPGYVFLNWLENGAPVSDSESYTFASSASRSLVANFIALPAMQATRAADGGLTVSWPAGAAGWVLQECPNLGLSNWTDSTQSVTVVGSQLQVTVQPEGGQRFFRLRHPR
jgi:hypothetical protein